MTAKQRRNKATHLSKQPTVTPEKIARNPPEGLKSLHHQARVSSNAHGLNPEIYLLRLNLDSLKQTKNLLGSSSLDLRPEITLWENVTGSLGIADPAGPCWSQYTLCPIRGKGTHPQQDWGLRQCPLAVSTKGLKGSSLPAHDNGCDF